MSRDYVGEAVEFIYKPLVSAFKKVISITFIREDFHLNCVIEDLHCSPGQLVTRIPKEWRKRARDDAFNGMRTFQKLIEDTARVTGQRFIDAPLHVERPKNPSLNATNLNDLQTNFEPFIRSNYEIWVDDEYADYKKSIADPKSKLFIKPPIVRMLIARYVREFVQFASDALPSELVESECRFDTEADDRTYDDFWDIK
jgi:hypothetical protein